MKPDPTERILDGVIALAAIFTAWAWSAVLWPSPSPSAELELELELVVSFEACAERCAGDVWGWSPAKCECGCRSPEVP